ncbi:MAG: hypothetical protein FJ222_11095 [Lentisphaerae bacterium]|nr:hypothetical protein [Lentisphaerota bacterium]
MSVAGDSYQRCLSRLPPPGGGGAHQAIFGAGCYGARAGVTVEQVCADVREHLPRGKRDVSDREIEEGVRAGFVEVAGGSARPRRPAARVAPGTFERIVQEGHGATEADIRARSPMPIDWPDWESSWRVLDALYAPTELIFVGEEKQVGRIGETIRPAGEWVAVLKALGRVPWPKLGVNPLTGRVAPKKSGAGVTLRGDACVAAHRFAVVEMDGASLSDQLAFWVAVPRLPVAAIVHSSGKSIHSWVRTDCADAAEWRQKIEGRLFPSYLEPMGVDGACKNASRMSRLPGHVRVDTGLVQRLLYLAPTGRAVNG